MCWHFYRLSIIQIPLTPWCEVWGWPYNQSYQKKSHHNYVLRIETGTANAVVVSCQTDYKTFQFWFKQSNFYVILKHKWHFEFLFLCMHAREFLLLFESHKHFSLSVKRILYMIIRNSFVWSYPLLWSDNLELHV